MPLRPPILDAWQYLPLHIRLRLAAIVFIALHPRPIIPKPLHYPLLVTALAFSILPFLPQQPAAILIALILAFLLAIPLTAIHRLKTKLNQAS